MSSRSYQNEDRISDLKDRAMASEQLMRVTLKTREHENRLQQILDDSKMTNIKVIGISEKS